MAQFIAQSFKEKQTKAGKTFYLASGTLDGNLEMVTMWEKPEIGKAYEGTTKENDYGITFQLPRQGGFGSTGGGRFNDPATRLEIIRQNALTNAVNKHIELSRQLHLEGKEEEAKEMLKPTEVCYSAYWFAKYTSGEWTPTMPSRAKEVEPQPEDDIPFDEEPAWLKEQL